MVGAALASRIGDDRRGAVGAGLAATTTPSGSRCDRIVNRRSPSLRSFDDRLLKVTLSA